MYVCMLIYIPTLSIYICHISFVIIASTAQELFRFDQVELVQETLLVKFIVFSEEKNLHLHFKTFFLIILLLLVICNAYLYYIY